MNTKLKLLNCNANIYFNKTCLDLNLTPKYAQTKIKTHNKILRKHIEDKMHILRIKTEIKFWYTRKGNFNKILYQLHIQNVKQWGNMQLLNKGLKYNLHFKRKDWIRTLAFDEDTAIYLLPDKNQSYMRQLVAKNIGKVQSKYSNMEEKRLAMQKNENVLNGALSEI
jgi:hypothetical protein